MKCLHFELTRRSNCAAVPIGQHRRLANRGLSAGSHNARRNYERYLALAQSGSKADSLDDLSEPSCVTSEGVCYDEQAT